MLGFFWNDRPNEKCLPLAYINDSSDFVNTTTNSLNHFFYQNDNHSKTFKYNKIYAVYRMYDRDYHLLWVEKSVVRKALRNVYASTGKQL
jgi:hypothetical protein